MGDDEQPQDDPGPITSEPTVRTPQPPIGEQQTTYDPGPLFSEKVTKSGTEPLPGLRIEERDSDSE